MWNSFNEDQKNVNFIFFIGSFVLFHPVPCLPLFWPFSWWRLSGKYLCWSLSSLTRKTFHSSCLLSLLWSFIFSEWKLLPCIFRGKLIACDIDDEVSSILLSCLQLYFASDDFVSSLARDYQILWKKSVRLMVVFQASSLLSLRTNEQNCCICNLLSVLLLQKPRNMAMFSFLSGHHLY